MWLKTTLGRRHRATGTRIGSDGHAQGAREGLEHRLGLMVRVVAAQVVDMHGDAGVIDDRLKEFADEIDIELADAGAGEIDIELPEWWDRFAHAGHEERESLLRPETAAPATRKKRRRRKKPGNAGGTADGAA